MLQALYFWTAASIYMYYTLLESLLNGLIGVKFISISPMRAGSRVVIASDDNGPGSTPGRGTLEDDSSFHP